MNFFFKKGSFVRVPFSSLFLHPLKAYNLKVLKNQNYFFDINLFLKQLQTYLLQTLFYYKPIFKNMNFKPLKCTKELR